MNAAEFLKAVWPRSGLYCIARPYVRKDGKPSFKHDGFHTAEEAAAFATRSCMREDVYFAIHSLKGTVTKTMSDGREVQWLARTAANAQAARALLGDIDCGPGKPYASKNEGRAALFEFCEVTGLPRPMVVNSGRGLHIYWLLVDEIDSATWKAWADILQALADFHGFKLDRACTTDTARVLRVIGTFNRKDPDNPRKVALLLPQPERLVNAVFYAQLLKAAEVLPTPEEAKVARLSEAEKPDEAAVLAVCPTFRKMEGEAATARGVVWMATNTLALHIKDGPALAHRLAARHPDYTYTDTQAKLQRLGEKAMGPMRCGKLQELYGEDSPCPTCAFFGRPDSSPVVFARQLPKSDLPEGVPQPESPYTRTKRGVEYQPPVTASDPAQKPSQVICSYDLFPSMIVDEVERESKAILWHAIVPKRGEVTFKLPSSIYHDEPKLLTALADRGVIVEKRNAKLLGSYMSHYIRLLQQHQNEHVQYEALGWTPTHDKFVLPSRALTPDGEEPALLSPNLDNIAAHMHTKGTLEGQIDALTFYDAPTYVRQQFFILAGLGAPLLWMTGYLGVIVNLSGPSGASKSTALEAVGGFWGRGDKYVMDGGEDGSTALGRAGRLRMLANLPFCLDEITLMSPEQLKRMAMSVTQQGDRVVRTRDGREKPIPDAAKSTLMLCTSNASAHALLSQNNQSGNAGSMRVFEVVTPRQNRHTKTEADAAIREFRKHYGHIGPLFMQFVIENLPAIQAEFTRMMATVDRKMGVQQEERFWAAVIVVVLVTLKIARKLELVTWEAKTIIAWLIEEQLPDMRRVVRDSYADPITILQSYIDSIANNMLVVSQTSAGMGTGKVMWVADRKPVGPLKARLEGEYGTLYLGQQAFKEYCDYRKIVFDTLVQELVGMSILRREKMDLARFIPEFASGQGRVLRVDLDHVSLAGTPPIEIDNQVVHLFPGKKPVVSR